MRRVIFALAALLLLSSCSLRRVGREEVEPEEKPTAPLFDPLAAAIDRVIVPEEYPIRAAAAGATEDSLAPPVDMDYREFDSAASVTTPTDVYRVQIFTSRLYSEATRELAIAEEIFNLPLYLDYEVPYYKLRVGDFTARDEAEDMLPEIKGIGYRNAWVARVLLRVRDVPGYDTSEEPILPELPEDSTALPADSTERESGSANR